MSDRTFVFSGIVCSGHKIARKKWNKIIHSLPWIAIFGSLVKQFANDYSWKWLAMANRLNCDPKSLFTETHALFFMYSTRSMDVSTNTLQCRHNEHDGVSNHQPHDCLLKRLFSHRSKKTSELRVTGLCAGNSPGTGEFPAQKASNTENFSTWWRHHVPIKTKNKLNLLHSMPWTPPLGRQCGFSFLEASSPVQKTPISYQKSI